MSAIQRELVNIIQKLDDEDVSLVLQLLKRFVSDDCVATDEDLDDIACARDEMARGEYITLADYKMKHGIS